jgi:hypothetical protein
MARFALRLRYVAILCGDWSRAVTRGGLAAMPTPYAVFLDPPYDWTFRDGDCYRIDDATVAHEVRAWCLEHGDDLRFRIVLAGFGEEHDDHMPDSWRRHVWRTVNSNEECLWFSPHCVVEQQALF